MSRLERKCFIGSAAFHGLLLVIFLFGSAFLASKPETPMQVITIIDPFGKVTDQKISTGGSPQGNPTPPPPAKVDPAPPPPPPAVEQPKVEPKKVEPEPPKKEVVKKVEPKKVETKKEIVKDTPKDKGDIPVKKETKKTPEKTKDVAENSKPSRTINTNVVKRPNSELIAAQAAAQRRAVAERERQEQARAWADYQRRLQAVDSRIAGVIDGTGKSLSKSTVVTPLGDGGAAYVNYGSLIRDIYDKAWIEPKSLVDENATVKVHVTVARNGRIVSTRIVSKSGNAALDKSVQRALDTVPGPLPAFPETTTDLERTFIFNFNLKTKQMSA